MTSKLQLQLQESNLTDLNPLTNLNMKFSESCKVYDHLKTTTVSSTQDGCKENSKVESSTIDTKYKLKNIQKIFKKLTEFGERNFLQLSHQTDCTDTPASINTKQPNEINIQTLFNISDIEETNKYQTGHNRKVPTSIVSSVKTENCHEFFNAIEQSTPIKPAAKVDDFENKRKPEANKKYFGILSKPLNYDYFEKLDYKKPLSKYPVNSSYIEKSSINEPLTKDKCTPKFLDIDYRNRIQELRKPKSHLKKPFNVSFGSVSDHENSEHSFVLQTKDFERKHTL